MVGAPIDAIIPLSLTWKDIKFNMGILKILKNYF